MNKMNSFDINLASHIQNIYAENSCERSASILVNSLRMPWQIKCCLCDPSLSRCYDLWIPLLVSPYCFLSFLFRGLGGIPIQHRACICISLEFEETSDAQEPRFFILLFRISIPDRNMWTIVHNSPVFSPLYFSKRSNW